MSADFGQVDDGSVRLTRYPSNVRVLLKPLSEDQRALYMLLDAQGQRFEALQQLKGCKGAECGATVSEGLHPHLEGVLLPDRILRCGRG